MLPQCLWVFLAAMGFGCHLAWAHGKTEPRKRTFGGWLLSIAIEAALLYWGGFFDSLISSLG